MVARQLVLGWDGADLALIRALGPDYMPETHRWMARGELSGLRSLPPYATLPNWLSMLTGEDPGTHGVYDFTERQGYGVRFFGGRQRAVPLTIEALDAAGWRCAMLAFPGTFPVPRLKQSVALSGWDAPVEGPLESGAASPPGLARCFAAAEPAADEFRSDEAGWHAALVKRLCAKIEAKTTRCIDLLKSRRWDLFAVYFGEPDTASHHLWSLFDPRSPRAPSAHSDPGLAKVYAALDHSLAALCEAAGDEVTLSIVSDHGSGGSSDRVLYLNRVLEEAGFLRSKPASPARFDARQLRQWALERLPAPLRSGLFHRFDRVLPSWLESQVRFGAIDMSRTQLFSDELNYMPAVHLNLRGREAEGRVAESERQRLGYALEDCLRALRDPVSGLPVFEALHPRETIYAGPRLHRAPDFLLEFALLPGHKRAAPAYVPQTGAHAGYSLNLMPSASAPVDAGPWRRLEASEYLGRKGRSLAGSHRKRGLLLSAGPQPLLSAATDPTTLDVGRALRALSSQPAQPSLSDSVDESGANVVEARLRALGYLG